MTELVHGALWRLVSTAFTKGGFRFCARSCITRLINGFYSGAATTASRMGQPDLAIATLNDFVGVSSSFLL